MNINDFYNKKSLELGWEDFGDFLDRMTVANIRDCVFLWTKEYADLVNEQTKQPEKALVINGVVKSDSEQLKDLEILSFEDWQEQNQELIRRSIGISGNEMAVELHLYSKYKTDQLLNL